MRRGVEKAQVAQRHVSVCEQLRQQVLQVGAQLRHVRLAELGTVIAELQAQAGAQFDAQGQWIVRALMVVQVTEGQAGRCALLERLGDREVFEHQQGVEQRALLAGPALDVVERHMFMVAQAEVEHLQFAEPRRRRLGWRGCADDRQGVDEQAQLLLDPRQRCGTPGYGGTKSNAVLAGVTLQQ